GVRLADTNLVVFKKLTFAVSENKPPGAPAILFAIKSSKEPGLKSMVPLPIEVDTLRVDTFSKLRHMASDVSAQPTCFIVFGVRNVSSGKAGVTSSNGPIFEQSLVKHRLS